LVEERRRVGKRESFKLRNLTRGIMSLLRALLRGLLHATTAHCFEIDGRCQRDQSFVRADIRSRFLTTNVLFAGRQRQHESSTALLVVSFADQTSRNLPRIFITRGEQSDVGSAKRNRHAKRLSFGHNNVGAASAR